VAKPGQTKRVVLIEFVLVLILGFFIAYMLVPDHVPPALSPRQLVAKPVPGQSGTPPVVPEEKPVPSEVSILAKVPALAKVIVPRKIEPINKAPAPVSVPVVDTRKPANSELPRVPKQVLTAIPESKMVLEVKPAEPPVTQTMQAPVPTKVLPSASEAKAALVVKPAEPPVNQPAQAPADVPEPKLTLEDQPVEPLVTQSVKAPIAKKVLPPVTDAKVALVAKPAIPQVNVPEPGTLQNDSPAQKLLPAESQANPSASDSEKSSTRVLVAGTVAAVVFAPIAVPASIIFGFAVGMFTPTASQLGQNKPIPTKRKHGKQPENTPVKQPDNTSDY
jgi:hypothetical protein